MSNYFLAAGLRTFPQSLTVHPLPYLQAITNPFVALGIGMQVYWLLSRMALLSEVDLSYLLTVTASGYTISALLGKMLLHEIVTGQQWVGILLITVGSALSGSTQHKTFAEPVVTSANYTPS